MKSEPTMICLDDRRRHQVRAAENWNGLDYIEVSEDQRHLTVYFLDQAPETSRPRRLRFDSGHR